MIDRSGFILNMITNPADFRRRRAPARLTSFGVEDTAGMNAIVIATVTSPLASGFRHRSHNGNRSLPA